VEQTEVIDGAGAAGADPATVRVSFVTWLPHCRRSDGIAEALGGRSHIVCHLRSGRTVLAPLRYLLQGVTTVRRLAGDRPDLVLVATPPVFAAIVVWAWCALTSSRFVIDAHTGAFDDPRWRWAQPLQRWLSRRATATIVTSDHLADVVRSWGAEPLVIGTVPVSFVPAPPAELGPGPQVVVVSTFSPDEPIDAVLSAARRTPEVTYHVTGDPRRAGIGSGRLPTNVRLTGWLSEQEYHATLQGADAVVCLTSRDHTMQRGGYEAMAIGQPLITSDWPLLRETFSQGTCHVDNSAPAIATAVNTVVAERDRLRAEMAELALRRAAEFQEGLRRLVPTQGDPP
jgi:glycosyltransferase involved in cell wall biosynthesis